MGFKRPGMVLPVNDLARSISFYRDRVGLPVDTDTGVPDTAVLTTLQKHRVLLAGPGAPAWSEILNAEHTVLKPGERIFMWEPEFDRRAEWLRQRGVEFRLIGHPWGDRKMNVSGPDGSGVTFQAVAHRTNQQVLELLQMAKAGLRGSTLDLTAEQLGWRPEPDSWSVREITHHVADTGLTVLHTVRVALAEPGKQYLGNPYDQDLYTTELRYQERDIEPSLALFEATLDTLRALAETIPDAWERSTVTSGGNETTARAYLEMLAVHSLEHLEQIEENRRRMSEQGPD